MEPALFEHPRFRPFGRLSFVDLLAIAALGKLSVDLVSRGVRDPQVGLLSCILAFCLAALLARYLVFVIRERIGSLAIAEAKRKIVFFATMTAFLLVVVTAQVLVSEWSKRPAKSRIANPSDQSEVPTPQLEQRQSPIAQVSPPANQVVRSAESVAVKSYLVEFSNGHVAKFDRMPTQQDIAEVQRKIAEGTIGAQPSGSGKLAEVFHPEMITADLAYFERVTGPARKTYATTKTATKTYKIDGCEVTATVSKGSIRSLRLSLTPTCAFDLNSFLPNYSGAFPSPNALTFGQFDSVSGGEARFMADCLTGCGNAADPVVFQHWMGGRADQFLEVMLEVPQVDRPALSAANRWQEAMQKVEGESWVQKTKFNCERTKHDAIAHKLFENVKIAAITVGYDIQTPPCER